MSEHEEWMLRLRDGYDAGYYKTESALDQQTMLAEAFPINNPVSFRESATILARAAVIYVAAEAVKVVVEAHNLSKNQQQPPATDIPPRG